MTLYHAKKNLLLSVTTLLINAPTQAFQNVSLKRVSGIHFEP